MNFGDKKLIPTRRCTRTRGRYAETSSICQSGRSSSTGSGFRGANNRRISSVRGTSLGTVVVLCEDFRCSEEFAWKTRGVSAAVV